MYFGRATLLFFRACYFAFYKTTGPIVDCENVIDLSGDMSFFRVAVEDAIEPSSRLRLGDACSNVNLDVYTGASTPSEANVVQIDGPADPNIDVRVWGPSRRVNGRSKDQRHDHVASVFQRSTSANVNCQYIFAKSGLNLWSLGNPTNPSGDQQQFEILAISPTGNQVSMLRLKTFGHISGSDPSTANYREMAISAFLNLASTTQSWVNFTGITPPPAPVGGYRLYVNAFGNLTLDTAEVSMKGHKHSASDVFGAVGLADTPTSASSPGEPGDVSYGPDHFYVCVAPNTWKRATITSW
jgi:hypothetical protein